MSYRVVVMLPSEKRPGKRKVGFCELRYSMKRRFIWFGRLFMDVSIFFGDARTIEPLERKEDADLTAQVVYLVLRNLGAEVKVEDCVDESL